MIEKRERRGRDGRPYTVLRVRWIDSAGIERSKTLPRGATRVQAERLETGQRFRVWLERELAKRRNGNGNGNGNGDLSPELVDRLVARRTRVQAEHALETRPETLVREARALEARGAHERASSAWIDLAVVVLAHAELARGRAAAARPRRLDRRLADELVRDLGP